MPVLRRTAVGDAQSERSRSRTERMGADRWVWLCPPPFSQPGAGVVQKQGAYRQN